MPHDRSFCSRRLAPLVAPLVAAVLSLLLPVAVQTTTAHAATVVPPPAQDASRIVAVVNGDVISNGDVDNRTRLFALSTGLPMSPDVLDRLRPQITRQLVDERLRMQEVLHRKIVVPDKDIAQAIHDIEQRNGMQPGTLRQKLAADGVSQRTLIDQIRTQLGWSQVLRQQLGDQAEVSDAQVAEQQRLEAQLVGKPEFRVGEIFIPVDDPANRADAQRFAETVIAELRKGAAFPVVAAQFSQTQSALQGGELGWVQPNELDPEVAQLVQQMPVGAISNPVPVPGGFSIVTLQGKREVGRDVGTILKMRETFLPFTSALNPQEPTDQQRQTLEKARNISATVHSCDQMEQVAKANNSPRPVDPGDVRLETINPPAFRQLLGSLPFDRASQPLVASDGIAVVIVCSREEKNLATLTNAEMRQRILSERVELASRQLQRDLRRQATIDIRSANGA
ncbi:MAG TPA: peptidylprolyl isomerase [Acetobacteraceae bacterium]|jgi:peptidyl-prolyl cis-trans isomerase SurA|nr:peptidylprolyl isomerase [Acetobacteraceae bacterium]